MLREQAHPGVSMKSLLSMLLVLWPAPVLAQGAGASPPASDVSVHFDHAEVDVHELKVRLAQKGSVLLDVRSEEEFAAGHIPGAVSVPVKHLPGLLRSLQAIREQTVFVSCQVSHRSGIAARELVRAGFSDVVQVLGGFSQWEAAGYPVER